MLNDPQCHDPAGEKDKTTANSNDEKFNKAETITLLLAQVSGIIFILLCAFLVWRSQTWQTWGLFLYSVWFNSGQYFFWYANLTKERLIIFDVVQVLLQAVGLTGFLAFALHFPSNAKGWRRTACPYLLGGAFVSLFVFNFLGYMNFFVGWRSELPFHVYYYLTLSVYALVGCIFLDAYLKRPSARPKIRWIALGGIWGLGWWLSADIYETTTMLNRLAHLLGGWPWLTNHWGNKGMTEQATLNLMYAMNVTLPLTVAYTALHHRVMGLRFFLIHAIAVIVPLTLAIVFTEEVLKGVVVKIMPVDWFAVLFSVAVTVVFHDWLHHQIEHLIFPGWYRERENLEETARELRDDIDDLDLDEVDSRLVQTMGSALRVKSAALFHSRDDGAPFIRQCVFNWPKEYMQSLPADYSFESRDSKKINLTSLVGNPKHLRDPDNEDDECGEQHRICPRPFLPPPSSSGAASAVCCFLTETKTSIPMKLMRSTRLPKPPRLPIDVWI